MQQFELKVLHMEDTQGVGARSAAEWKKADDTNMTDKRKDEDIESA